MSKDFKIFSLTLSPDLVFMFLRTASPFSRHKPLSPSGNADVKTGQLGSIPAAHYNIKHRGINTLYPGFIPTKKVFWWCMFYCAHFKHNRLYLPSTATRFVLLSYCFHILADCREKNLPGKIFISWTVLSKFKSLERKSVKTFQDTSLPLANKLVNYYE